MVRIEIKGDPEEIVNVNTPEAAAEFKRKRDAGEFGVRNQAEWSEHQRLLDAWGPYEDDMGFVEFCERLEAGTLPQERKP